MRKNNDHNVSGLESVYGGSMFLGDSDSAFLILLDTRSDKDTFRDLAEKNIEQYGSAIVSLTPAELI